MSAEEKNFLKKFFSLEELIEKLPQRVSCFALAVAMPSLSKNEIEAIAHLRHSLAHNFGLASKNKWNSDSDHKFWLTFGINDQLIKLPEHPWKGEYSNKSDERLTKTGFIHWLPWLRELSLLVITN